MPGNGPHAAAPDRQKRLNQKSHARPLLALEVLTPLPISWLKLRTARPTGRPGREGVMRRESRVMGIHWVMWGVSG